MTTQHTPTPWATQGRVKITRHVDGFQINQKMFVAIARDVTEPGNPPFAYAENPQIAAFIVRACNAHENLLNACYGLSGILEELGVDIPQDTLAAIAKAEGK